MAEVYQDITEEQQKAYLQDKGVRCPFCKSENTSSHEHPKSSETGKLEQTIECRNCLRLWIDTYTLTKITAEALLCPVCGDELKFGQKTLIHDSAIVHEDCLEP